MQSYRYILDVSNLFIYFIFIHNLFHTGSIVIASLRFFVRITNGSYLTTIFPVSVILCLRKLNDYSRKYMLHLSGTKSFILTARIVYNRFIFSYVCQSLYVNIGCRISNNLFQLEVVSFNISTNKAQRYLIIQMLRK